MPKAMLNDPFKMFSYYCIEMEEDEQRIKRGLKTAVDDLNKRLEMSRHELETMEIASKVMQREA